MVEIDQAKTVANKSKPDAAELVIYWDYDTQWGGDRARSRRGPVNYGDMEFRNTQRLLELHAQYAVPACFAVVGAAARPGGALYSNPAQIQQIHSEGHEVASHTMYHDWIPGLAPEELERTLRESKDALEQCVGAEVVSLVPPYNEPMDLPNRGAWSIPERWKLPGNRTGLPRLCACLAEVGYRTCRVLFSTLPEKLSHLLRLPVRRVVEPPFSLNGITCLRLSGGAGFDKSVVACLRALHGGGRPFVVYGHPHSIYADNPQNERRLIEFLEVVSANVRSGDLVVRLPRDYEAVSSTG